MLTPARTPTRGSKQMVGDRDRSDMLSEGSAWRTDGRSKKRVSEKRVGLRISRCDSYK